MSAASRTRYRNLAQYYRWDVSERNARIYPHAGMVDRLQADVAAGLQFPAGPRETGGILLGFTEQDGERSEIFVEDFVAVPISYAAGPLYRLSAEDGRRFESALLRAAFDGSEANAPPVLGYYRAHTREALSLAAEDHSLIQDYFSEPSSVIMLVKSVMGAKACTAGFFFWEDDHLQGEFSALEVALGRMPASDPQIPTTAQAASEAEREAHAQVTRLFETAADEIPQLPPLQPPRNPSPWAGLLVRFAVIVAATIALVFSAIRYISAPKPVHPETAASGTSGGLLGLQADQTRDGLLVSWNQRAPEIASAGRGVLLIQDGTAQKSLELDKSQLASGNVLYTPAGDDIEFRLEVYSEGHPPAVQALRVLKPSAAR